MAKKKKKDFRAAILTGLVLFLIVIISVGMVLIRKYSPSKEFADLNEIYQMDRDTNSVTNAAILYNNELIEDRAIVSDGGLYLSIDFIQKELNHRFYWEEESELLIYTTPTDVIKATVDSASYYIGNSIQNFERIIIKEGGSTIYVSADFVAMYTAFDYSIYQDPNRVLINTNYTDEITKAGVKKATQIRVLGGIKSDIVTEVEKGDVVTIIEELDDSDWVGVMTVDGKFGYMQTKKLSSYYTEIATTDFVEPVYTSLTRDGNISLVWHQVAGYAGNDTIYEYLKGTSGITVVSPTWFYLKDNYGNIADLASSEYVNYIHGEGMEVWALVSNFEDSDVDTCAVLGNTENREHLEAQLLAAAIEYKLDGINIDFEDLPSRIGQSYIQFLREFSILCRKNGIVLSVDNYSPAEYNSFYEWEEQGVVADYVILMGYDEHYNGSAAGSVASIGWVEEGLQTLTSMVPSSKVILGMPFYTRLWATDIEGNVSSSALSMTASWDWVRNNNLEAEWDYDAGQYYVSDIQGNSIYDMWLEDDTSLNMKVILARKYETAGTACWKLGMQEDDVWDVINQ